MWMAAKWLGIKEKPLGLQVGGSETKWARHDVLS